MKFSKPFLSVNPKNYLYGKDMLEYALKADKVAEELDMTVMLTAPYTDLRMVRDACPHVCLFAQSMDPVQVGRGMGRILPEALKDAGCDGIILNHAENPKTINDFYVCTQRAHELGMLVMACANSPLEAKACVAMGADIVVPEPTDLIGTGKIADEEYMHNCVKEMKSINPEVVVNIGAGVTCPEDCYFIVKNGSDGTGATSGLLKQPDHYEAMKAWAQAIKKGYEERMEEENHE